MAFDSCYFVVVFFLCVSFSSFDFSGLGLFSSCVFLDVVHLFRLEFSFCRAGYIDRNCLNLTLS